MKTYNTIHDAYLGTLQDVYFNYDYKSAPRGMPIREKTDYTFRVQNPVSEPIVTHDLDRNKVIAEYTKKEVELYNSCADTALEFGKASKFWEKLANPDGTLNSAYGHLIWKNKSHGNPNFEFKTGNTEYQFSDDYYMRTPWEWAKQSLIQDKDTRQAILRFSLPEHAWIGVRDFTCTMHANFLIRDDKLNISVVMRSNDLQKGLVFDLPFFCSLMDKMLVELKPQYPDLVKGHYTHIVHSIHIYEKDESTVLKMLGM